MSETLSLAVLSEMFDSDYWARDRQLQALRGPHRGAISASAGGQLPFAAGRLDASACRGVVVAGALAGTVAADLVGPPEEIPTLAALSQRWETVEREMREYVAGLREDALQCPVACRSTRGQTWTFTLWRMMQHLLQHQTYHRGQVTTLLRQLGTQPPKVNFLDAHKMGFRS